MPILISILFCASGHPLYYMQELTNEWQESFIFKWKSILIDLYYLAFSVLSRKYTPSLFYLQPFKVLMWCWFCICKPDSTQGLQKLVLKFFSFSKTRILARTIINCSKKITKIIKTGIHVKFHKYFGQNKIWLANSQFFYWLFNRPKINFVNHF